ncbi:MAG TPA: hypothetical protein VG936_14475 [Lacunisphaera sp.]|nr:hypothetical protein [Lacunisphaera sp.]
MLPLPHLMRFPAAGSNVLRWLSLLVVTAAVWLVATGRWRPAVWQFPVSYNVDALEVLARLKLSGDLGLAFLFDKTMPSLGAPWGADWSSYPMPDVLVFVFFGKLAAAFGLGPASNLALLFAHLAAVATFYLCSRALGHRASFAAGAALLFGFSFFIFHRGLTHYSFTLAYVVPAQLLSVWLVGGARRLLLRRRWQLFCIATAVATGMGNPYFGFGYGLLLCLALGFQLGTTHRRPNLVWGGASLAAFLFTLLFFNYSAILAMFEGQLGLERNYAGTEIYGLHPIEWLIPPQNHQWSVAADIGRRYASVTSLRGELFSPYFGVVGLAGLAVLFGDTLRRLLWQRAGFRPAYAATFALITLFFVVGGFNSLLALAGVDLFRAGNRYSIYLLAICLLVLASWASRRFRHLPPRTVWIATVLVVAFGLWDQLPRRREVSLAEQRRRIDWDKQFSTALAAHLPPGAAIFQLPVVAFLEQPPINRMTDYELFRPWLNSSNLRFSYGLLAQDRALRWERRVAALPVEQMCTRLEAVGYAAVYLNKTAYPDAGNRLRAQLEASGRSLLAEIGDHVAYALHPAAQPVRPDLDDPRLADPWNGPPAPGERLQLYADRGWFALERDEHDKWRWAGEAATLSIWNADPSSVRARLSFHAAALRPGQLRAKFAGEEIWASSVEPVAHDVTIDLILQPGANRIDFELDGRLKQASLTDSRLLGFQLTNLQVTPHQ